jgi:hypothetical protein
MPKGRIAGSGCQLGTPGGDAHNPVRAWRDRIRDPSLTALLVLEVAGIFVAAPLAARGLLIARVVGDTLILAAQVIVVMLSRRLGAILAILLGLTATAICLLFGARLPAAETTLLSRGGDILAFLALTWVVAQAVYAPGRITAQRLQGAVVIYLSVAILFAAAYGMIWELMPGAFANLHAAAAANPRRLRSFISAWRR